MESTGIREAQMPYRNAESPMSRRAVARGAGS